MNAVGLFLQGECLFEATLDHFTVYLFICGRGGLLFFCILLSGETWIVDICQGFTILEIAGQMVLVEFQFRLVAGQLVTNARL